MAIMSTNFAQLLYPGLRTIWGDTYKGFPDQYTQIFDVETSDKAYENSVEITGFGYASEKTEGNAVNYDTAYQGYTKTWTNVTYGIGFQVTSEMWEDDQYGKIRALPKALARSVKNTVELTAANILNRAFVTTYTTGPDSKELCATDHPLVGGGTEQNELTTAADLSMTSLEQALIDIGDITDARGLLAGIKAQKLIVPSELEWTAKQLLQSDKDPESNYNAINPANGIFPGGYAVNNYLTDPDAWFIKTDATNGLVFFWRRRPDLTNDNEFSTENALYKSVFRCVPSWNDYRAIFGSPGA